LILDLFGCNFLGIIFGLLTLKFFSVRKFDWVYKKDQKLEDKMMGNCSMLTKAIQKLKPVFFLQHDWKML
jgi:phosphatidylserine synthase 2